MRPIDADALITLYKNWLGQLTLPEDEGDERGITSCIEVMEEAPTLDVVKVVRCKDCKYLRIDEEFASGRYCALRNVNGGKFCKDNDFCSYGQRRSN